ncbi:Ppef1 [Symbiodinium sp. CCMP2592]|nr:Ppef1 [Symbiodinium sp. CCMP2592]
MADQFEDYTPDPEGHVICAVQPLGATTFRVLSDGTYSALLVKYTGSIGSAAIVTASRSLSESIDSKAENLGLELIVLRATNQAVSFWQKMGQLGLRSWGSDPKLNSYEARYSAAPKNDKEKQLLQDYGLLAWLEDSLPTDPAPTPSGQGQDEGDSSPGSLRHLPPSGGGLPRPSGLPQVAFELEEAEEFRSLQQAKVAERLQSQICAGRRQAASSDGSHRTKSGSKLQVKLGPIAQSERQKGVHEPLSEKALLDTLRGLCESPGTPLKIQLVEQVLLAAEEFLYYGRHEAIAELRVPEASEKSGPEASTSSPNRVVVVGDLHGQLQDLLWIFQKHGLPSESQRFLFNGDVADRGRNAMEIFVVIFGFMVSMPGSVHMNRGNHEEEGMNCASVGGFYNECLSKYGRTEGGRIFDAMKRLYALLPLATVIEKSVFVVHGGLSRCPHPLRLLRSLHERPSCLPTEPATAAEQVMIDFLWSDPCDMPGLSPSKRGGQMIRFGPDVTKQFLEDSGFALVVRSHEVPKNNDGVYVMHENRLVTVFSASNYMGSVGNHGAVLLFHASGGKLSFNESRHFAPALSAREFLLLRSTLEDALGLPREQTDIPRLQLQAAEMAIAQSVPQEDPQQDRLPKELLRQVAQLVVEQKPALFAFFFAHDVSKTGFIDVQDWLQGCRAVLGDLPWEQLRQLLAVEEPGSNMVDYVAFVHRFRVGLAGSEISDEWAQTLVSRVFERLIYSDWPIAQMLHHFDRDGNGTVTAAELREAFVELDVGITGPQAFSLLRTMTAHGTADQKRAGGISIESFLSLFEMTFHPHATGQVRVPGWVTASLRVLGGLIWQGTSGEDRARQFFERADANGNGLLSLPELVAGITQLCQAKNVDLQLTRKDFLDLAKWVDISGEGQVNYVEFLKAFLPAGLSDGSFQADIMESICTTIWSNKTALLRACLTFDSTHSGRVARGQLAEALRHLESRAGEELLTAEQVAVLLDHTKFNAKTEQVRYRRFLDSFQVFDTAPTCV